MNQYFKMKNKKKRLLWSISNCCFKKVIDLDIIAKYGSIIAISIILLSQILNISESNNIRMSFFSMFINIFFLLVVLNKVEILKLTIFEEQMNSILKFIIFVFVLNFFAYLISEVPIHNYFFAPVSFLGAYFIFVLLKTK
ncbi:putative membrane protein [Arcobacter venerupis]|uniref:Membrane protein n=2 Tax=Arcobacter venerupis TaxID=1054033 RepID=A0AAE7E450_9BACT|nr:putative membrane protein [Arcobacter venerupis]